MDYKERKQWLNSLKVGDEVTVHEFKNVFSRFICFKIIKITPKRTKFVVEIRNYTLSFDKNGYYEKNSIYNEKHMTKLTVGIRNNIKYEENKLLLKALFSNKSFLNSLSF